MKRKFVLTTILTVAISVISFSQVQFTIHQSPADSLRDIGDLSGAITEYEKIYKLEPENSNNLYNYSCALSISGQIDSCFKYLNLAIELDTSTIALTDPDFIPIREKDSWNDFENRLIAMLNEKFDNPYKDLEYAKILWEMMAFDQAYYTEIKLAELKVGKNSSVVKALWKLKHILNEKNQEELEKLIELKGWPKQSEVGRRAASAAFLIIQHSNIDKQKKYLPIIEDLCKEKEADLQHYALMYDRVQTSENKPQKFGTQIRYNEETKTHELFPLLDETKVEEWRKECNMMPLEVYVLQWGIKWEPNNE